MRIHHIVLYCTAPDASRAWYESAGFHYLRGYGGMHWVALGEVELMLHPHPEGPGPGAPQLYAAVPSLDAHFAHCRDQGLFKCPAGSVAVDGGSCGAYDGFGLGHSISSPLLAPGH